MAMNFMRSRAISSLRREPRGRADISMIKTPRKGCNPPVFPGPTAIIAEPARIEPESGAFRLEQDAPMERCSLYPSHTLLTRIVNLAGLGERTFAVVLPPLLRI